MKKISILLLFAILLVSGRTIAQAKDSVPAKKVIEQATKGDIIVGKEIKKKQLNAPPQMLQRKDSANKTRSTYSKKRKCKNKDGKTRN